MPKDPASPAARRPRVLCADDESAIRDVLRALLRREGCDVESVATGAEAWRKLAEAPRNFDLLITDNEMPELAGLALVRKLREAGNEVKIIVFSASLTTEDEDAFRAWQVDAVVAKGSPIDELLGELRRVLQQVGSDVPGRPRRG